MRDYTISIASELANFYRVILFDRPGLGHSERITNMGDTLKDQARLLRDAALMLGAERTIVLGHRYGGSVALAWALEAPDNIAALINLSGVSHPWTTGLGTHYKVTSHPYSGWLGTPFISAFKPEMSIQARIWRGISVAAKKIVLANARQRLILKPQIVDQAPDYTSLTLPIEIIHGTEDTVVSPELHAKALEIDAQNAHFTLLEGVGHMPYHIAEQSVIDAIEREAERSGLRQGHKECMVRK